MTDDRVQNALEVIKERRGDSFDIGENLPATVEPEVIRILQNPHELADMLHLTEQQADNLRSLIIGGGTGGVHRLLSRYFGDEASAVIGALASTWLSRKVIRR